MIFIHIIWERFLLFENAPQSQAIFMVFSNQTEDKHPDFGFKRFLKCDSTGSSQQGEGISWYQ